MAEFLQLREKGIKISKKQSLDRKSENSTIPIGVEGKEKNMDTRGSFYMPTYSLTLFSTRG